MELTITYDLVPLQGKDHKGIKNYDLVIADTAQRHCRDLLQANWRPSGHNQFTVSAPDIGKSHDDQLIDQYAEVLKSFGATMDDLRKAGIKFTCALAVPS